MGRSAFFIRTYGCPLGCRWCDAAGTWHKDWVPKHIERHSAEYLAEMVAKEMPVAFAVITGGEPTVFDLLPLTLELENRGCNAHLETSGAFPIRGDFDWVTLSPKRWKMPLEENLLLADEFKIIVEKPEDIEFYVDHIEGKQDALWGNSVWLHPEWSQRENPVVLGAISEFVKRRGDPFRAGWQIHKNYMVDSRDSRSQPMVPLGGDLRKGF